MVHIQSYSIRKAKIWPWDCRLINRGVPTLKSVAGKTVKIGSLEFKIQIKKLWLIWKWLYLPRLSICESVWVMLAILSPEAAQWLSETCSTIALSQINVCQITFITENPIFRPSPLFTTHLITGQLMHVQIWPPFQAECRESFTLSVSM